MKRLHCLISHVGKWLMPFFVTSGGTRAVGLLQGGLTSAGEDSGLPHLIRLFPALVRETFSLKPSQGHGYLAGLVFFLVSSVEVPCTDYYQCDSVPPNVRMPSTGSRRSTPPMNFLYASTMAGMETIMWGWNFRSQHFIFRCQQKKRVGSQLRRYTILQWCCYPGLLWNPKTIFPLPSTLSHPSCCSLLSCSFGLWISSRFLFLTNIPLMWNSVGKNLVIFFPRLEGWRSF